MEAPLSGLDKLSDDRFGEPSAAIRELHLSIRAYRYILSPSTMLGVHLPKGAWCILKLARTITDVSGSASIETPYLAEAIQYQPRRQV